VDKLEFAPDQLPYQVIDGQAAQNPRNYISILANRSVGGG
jgi:hypothetical protein